jgi:hypothetical protein
MADAIKDRDNKDQESGRPVQLEREQQGGQKQGEDTQGQEQHQPEKQGQSNR